MGIVDAERMFSSNLNWARRTPGSGCSPSAMVFLCIFEVAVLHQFGIKTTISRIADILEEDSDEFIANLFLFRWTDGQRSMEWRLRQEMMTGVIVHTFVSQTPIGS